MSRSRLKGQLATLKALARSWDLALRVSSSDEFIIDASGDFEACQAEVARVEERLGNPGAVAKAQLDETDEFIAAQRRQYEEDTGRAPP